MSRDDTADATPFSTLKRAGSTLAERALGLERLSAINRCVHHGEPGIPWVQRTLRYMGVQSQVSSVDLERIPINGPLIVVCNHPHGVLDGLLLIDLISRRREDVRVLANAWVNRFSGFEPLTIPMTMLGEKDQTGSNAVAFRRALRHLLQGGALLTFPAGEVSAWRWDTWSVADAPWQRGVAQLSRRGKAPVLPVFIEGRNSLLFQLAGLVHPRLRTALLPHAFLDQKDKSFSVLIGNPVACRQLERLESHEERIATLRLRTEILARRLNEADASSPTPTPIASPIAKEEHTCDLIGELRGLSPESILVTRGTLRVYLAAAEQIPMILREIGRLREMTFRDVAEGTGLERDLDRFDSHYLHLFLWDEEASRIAGAYRLGPTDQILKTQGANGLYTTSLFHFDPRFFDAITPGIELGRSFVRKEYQRNYLPLLMLWQGIGHYVARHPQRRRLFGPVSISRAYSESSRHLMLEHLGRSAFSPELASFVRARRSPGVRFRRWPAGNGLDLQTLSETVSALEADGKGVPILIREYLKLGGRMVAFSRDPDFGDVVDALVVVDLNDTKPELLKRYMSAEGYERFRRGDRLSEAP